MTQRALSVSVRVEHRNMGRAAGQRRHDTRSGVSPQYVDTERSVQNSILVEPKREAELRQICEERRARRSPKRARKRDAAVATVGILTFSRDAQPIIEALSVAEQDALYRKAAEAIAERLQSTVTGLVVHRDEAAPHAHFQLPAIGQDGIPLSKKITPTVATELQDLVGSIYAVHGIHRGTSKAERIARGEEPEKIHHRSVAELHRTQLQDYAKELEAEQQRMEQAGAEREALEQELAELTAKAEKNRRLLAEQQAKLEAGRVSEEQARKRMEAYERREHAALSRVLQLQTKVDDLSLAQEHLEPVVQHLRKEQERLEPQVANLKKQEIEAAARVAQLGQDEKAAQERVEALQETIDAKLGQFLGKVQSALRHTSQELGRAIEAMAKGMHDMGILTHREYRDLDADAENLKAGTGLVDGSSSKALQQIVALSRSFRDEVPHYIQRNPEKAKEIRQAVQVTPNRPKPPTPKRTGDFDLE